MIQMTLYEKCRPGRAGLRTWLTGACLLVVAVVLVMSCQSEPPMTPTQQHIYDKTEDLFSRIKVNDYSVIWENEFAYFREDSPLEEYLNNDYMKWYKPDTLIAIQIDSIVVSGEDSAYAAMKVEWLQSDSSLKIDTIRLPWIHSQDEWLKPTLSNLQRQLDFEEELRVYWEAVKAMQEEEDGDESGTSEDDSAE